MSSIPPGLHEWLNSPAGRLYLRDQVQMPGHLPSPNSDGTAAPNAPVALPTPSPLNLSFPTQHPTPVLASTINQPGAEHTAIQNQTQQHQSTTVLTGNPSVIPSQTVGSTAEAPTPSIASQIPPPPPNGAPALPGAGNHVMTYHHIQLPASNQVHQPLQLHPQQAAWPQPTHPYVGSIPSSLAPAYFQQPQVMPSTLAAPTIYTPPPPSVSATTAMPIEPYRGVSGAMQAMPNYSYGAQNPPPARGLTAIARSTASAVNDDRMRSASGSRGLPRTRGRSQGTPRPATAPYSRSRSSTPTFSNTPSPALIGDFANIEVHIYIPLRNCDEYGFQFLRLRRDELQAQLQHYGAVIELPGLSVATTHLSQIMARARQRAETGPHHWSFKPPSGPASSTNPFASSVFDCLVPAVKSKLKGKEHALQPIPGGVHMTLHWILKDPQSPFIRHHQYSGTIRPDGSYWFTIRLITKSPEVTGLILNRPGHRHSCIAVRMFNRKMTDTRKEDSDEELPAPLDHTDPVLTSEEEEDEMTQSASAANSTTVEQRNTSLPQDDYATHSNQDLQQIPPLVPFSITVEAVADGLSSQPIPPFEDITKIWDIISDLANADYPLAADDFLPPLEAPRLRLIGENDEEVAMLLWNTMTTAAEHDDCSLLLTRHRSFSSGPGFGFGIERQALSLLARDKFCADRADYWAPRRNEYCSPASSLPATIAGSISQARLLEMKTLGILTGFHIALLGAAPPLFSPVHFQLAMHGNDPRSLSSALLDHFDPELRQLQDQWRRLPLNESPAQGSALFYFIVHYLETPPQALANRSQAAHDAFPTQMALAAYVGVNGTETPEMRAFVSGLELPCENGLRLSHAIRAFRPTSVDALIKLWDTVPSDWESLGRDNRFEATSAVGDIRLHDLLCELRQVTGNPNADFKDYLEAWLQGSGCMSIAILRDQISQGVFPPQISEDDVMKPSFRVATFYEVATSSYRYMPGVTAKATFVNDTDGRYDSNPSSRPHNIAEGVIRASSCFGQVFIPASALLKRLRADSSPPEGQHATPAASVEWFFTFGFANAFGKFTTV